MNENNLHGYQKKAIDHILTHSHCALFLEMGLGKTVSTLTAINHLLYRELDITRVLVIAPKRVAESVWDAEINKWDHLSGMSVSKIIGSEKQRVTALFKAADIYLLGRDNVEWFANYIKKYRKGIVPFDMLVIDELSSFKNPRSHRFKAIRNMRHCFKRIVGLTGTPAPNGLMDLWGQIFLLDGGKRLGRFITHYRDAYFKPGKRNGAIIYTYDLQKDGAERIYKQIGDICMSMKAEDYLKLPGRIENVIPIKLTSELQKRYDEFEKEQILSLDTEEENTEISAVNAAALSNKLLQFANGAMYDENGKVHVLHDLKIDACKELLEDADGKPVLIAWTFRSDRDRLLEALRMYKPRELQGQKDIDDWNAGKIKVLLMHPASGGHGLNLQMGGHIIIWYGQTWSLELEQQFNARLDRQGQQEKVIINKLVAVDTIDRDIIKALNNKDKTQESLMQAVKDRIRKYTQNTV